MPHSRFADETKWNVSQLVLPDGDGPCLSYLALEQSHYGLPNSNYKLIAETEAEQDAVMVAACRNHGWDEDYVSFLERYHLIVEAILSPEHTEELDLGKIDEMVKEARDSLNNTSLFQCFGTCMSRERKHMCDACYAEHRRIWETCASVRIQRHIGRLITSDSGPASK